MQPDITALGDLLIHTGLLTAPQVQALAQRWRAEGPAGADVQQFGKWLVASQYVTDYQLGRLLKGQTDHYFFNQYKLLDRIGSGRMAGVFKAVHRLGQVVAIKVLPPSKAKDPAALARFQREARLALRLKHPNIVRTFQAGEAGGMHYLVMEYLDGETLEEVLTRRGKLPPEEAVRLVQQALEGLQHLHEQGMIRRDLKPGNLMLVPAAAPGQPDTTLEATVKILDIGVGRALFDEGDATDGGPVELTQKGDLLGAPDYMAPEQGRDAHAADIRADLYGLGCVLYHALTGQPPFPGGNLVAKLTRHAKETPRPLADFQVAAPPRLQETVSRLLAKDPAKRYPTPATAAQALASSLSQSPAPARARPAVAPKELVAYESWLIAEDPEVARAARTPASGLTSILNRRAALVAAGVGVVLGSVVLTILAVVLGIVLFRPGQPAEKNHATMTHPESTRPVEDARPLTLDEWIKEVAALPTDQQAAAVAGKLKERNPSFSGAVKHRVQDNAVTDLEFVTDDVTDITPVRALASLKRLSCAGSDPGKGKLADLQPLAGMELAVLDCSANPLTQLAPLRGMPLIFLGIAGTQVRDLSPVATSSLMVLNCAGTPVHDLAPLRGLELTLLDAADTAVTDLTPLKGMPLEALWCPVQPLRDAELLRGLARLKEVNGKPAADIQQEAATTRQALAKWAKAAAAQAAEKRVALVIAKLQELNPGFNGDVTTKIENGKVVEVKLSTDAVTDLSPLQALPELRRLFCHGSAPGMGKLANLQPLRGLKLTELDCGLAQIQDLTPLAGMPLTYLNLDGNGQVSDLKALKGMSLVRLSIADTGVRDLMPLRDMALASLACHGTPVKDLSPLAGMPLTGLSCDWKPARDLTVLRSLKKLEKLNNRAWPEIDSKHQGYESWAKSVAGMPAGEQVKAVAAAFKERNPGFAGTLTPTVTKGVVSEMRVRVDQVNDLSPLQALRGLKKLTCTATPPTNKRAPVDLWPLRDLPLTELILTGAPVADLTPLKNMKLATLDLEATLVDDLTPLAKMPLQSLNVKKTTVHDFSPLQRTALKFLKADVQADRDRDGLDGIKSLMTINGNTVAETWRLAAAGLATSGAHGKKPTPVSGFRGRVIATRPSDLSLTVQVTQTMWVQSPYHTAQVIYHQRRLGLDAPRMRNPVERMRFIQNEMLWIAYHQSLMYRQHRENQEIEVQAAPGVQVRVAHLPTVLDDRGKPRKYTAKELAELKGPDAKLPGYTADFNTLARNQIIDVQLARIDAADRRTYAANTPLQAVVIFVAQKTP